MPATGNARRRLNPGLIADAAIALLDRDGPSGLSARRLAASLGCEAMSLYNHVENMEAVLDLVVDRLLGGLLPSLEEVGGTEPRQALTVMAGLYLELAERHPHGFMLIATRRWHTPAATRLAGLILTRIAGPGVPLRAALGRARELGAYLNGAGLALAAWRTLPKGEGAVPVPDPTLANAFNAKAVREDLLAGLDRLVGAIA